MDDLWRDRLKQRMGELGFTAKSLSLAAGHGETFIRDLLAGSTPSVEKLSRVAEVLGVTVGYILDGDAPTFQKVHVIGQAETAESWAPFENNPDQGADVEIRIEGGEPIAIEVQGDSLFPAYRDKDILIGAKSIGRYVDNLVGLDCIVMTEDGRRYVKILQKGTARGTFNLRSMKPGKDDILGVKVVWAAPISWIRRSRH